MQQTPAASSSKRRAKFAIGALVVLFALLGLMGWALSRPEATSFYVTVSELQAMSAPAGDVVRVNGTVVPGSIERDGLSTTFAISEGGEALRISTSAPLPDALKPGSEVVARGTFDGRRFVASEVLAKCPSKFQAA
jgi:cytochrome c-type biogenesis protein CcmE